MKKFGCFMIVLMMAVSGLALLPKSYTHSEKTITATSVIDETGAKDGVHTYYPEKYMHLSHPNVLATSEDYVVASNDSDLYVYDNRSNTGYVQSKVFDEPDFTVSQIALLGDFALILKTSTQQNKIMLKDLRDAKSKPKQSDIGGGLVTAVSTRGNQFVLVDHKSDSLTYATIVEDKLILQNSEKISLGTLTMFEAKIYNDILYFYNDGVLYKYNFADKKVTIVLTKDNITDYAVIGNDIVYTTGDMLYKYNTLTQKHTSTPITNQKDSLSVFGDKIYLTSKQNNQILIYDQDLIQVDYFGDKGGEIDRLDTPMGVSYDMDNIYVADSENKRIIVTNSLGEDRQSIPTGGTKPILATKTETSLYILASDHMVYKQNADSTFSRFGEYENVIDMDRYEDNLVLLTASEVIIVTPNGEEQRLALVGVNDIIVPYGTNRLYAFTDSEIVKYDIEKFEEISRTPAPANNAHYAIDYYGNLYTKDNGYIKKYILQEDSYTLSVNLDMSELNGANQCVIDTYNGNMYLTNPDTHLLYSVDRAILKSTSIKNDSYAHPTQYDILKVAIVNSPNAHSYITPKNTESARNVAEGTEVLILAEVNIDNIDYYYVAYADGEEQNYIKKSELSAPYEHISMDSKLMSALYNNTAIYEYPFAHSKVLKTINRDTEVSVIYQLTSDSKTWDWYQIQYVDNGSTQLGYVKLDYLGKVTDTAPPKPVQFLTTKSKNVGEKIKLYSAPDTSSSILADSIDDGVEIQMLQDKFDKNSTFTKVRYQGQTGYILTENLQEAGLTPSQIIAITVSVVAAVAFILIIVLLVQKKKVDNKPTDYTTLQ